MSKMFKSYFYEIKGNQAVYHGVSRVFRNVHIAVAINHVIRHLSDEFGETNLNVVKFERAE